MNNVQPVEKRSAAINTDYIELDKLLKREDLAASGGAARYLISQGLAWVNGAQETRKRRKLYPGDLVVCNGVEIWVAKTEPCSYACGAMEQGS